MKKKKQPVIPWFFWPGVVALATIILGSIVLTSYHLAYWQRVYPGVTVLGHPLGNKTLAQVEQTVRQISQPDQNTLLFQYGSQQWPLSLAEINLEYQPALTARKALEIGRNFSFGQNLKAKLTCWRDGCDLPLDYTFAPSPVETQVELIANQIFVPAIEPMVEIKTDLLGQKIIQIQPGQAGRQLDKRQLMEIIKQTFAYQSDFSIPLPLIQLTPQLTDQQATAAKRRAESLLGKVLILTHQPPEQTQPEEWWVNDEELINFLDFGGSYKRDQIDQWVGTLTQSVNRPAQDALFQFIPETQRVVEFKPSKKGQDLNETATTALIIESLAKLEAGKSKVIAPLPVTFIPPQLDTAEANNLGIHELISQGVSHYAGSAPDRIFNLALAANKLNGVVIAPGETFSFLQRVGEISVATGYRQGYVIKEGRTILDDGGGVCQTSTTMFRAALDAGLPILERQAHAYRVSYYEQKYQPGFDATVFFPNPDLRFKNDTPGHILIQTDIDAQQAKLTFSFYGTKDGRTVTISAARTLERTAPPPDLYIDDPTLPAGQVKQVEHKIWGAKVAFDYKVTRGEEVLQEQTFWSVYKPWQAVFLRGTGG